MHGPSFGGLGGGGDGLGVGIIGGLGGGGCWAAGGWGGPSLIPLFVFVAADCLVQCLTVGNHHRFMPYLGYLLYSSRATGFGGG